MSHPHPPAPPPPSVLSASSGVCLQVAHTLAFGGTSHSRRPALSCTRAAVLTRAPRLPGEAPAATWPARGVPETAEPPTRTAPIPSPQPPLHHRAGPPERPGDPRGRLVLSVAATPCDLRALLQKDEAWQPWLLLGACRLPASLPLTCVLFLQSPSHWHSLNTYCVRGGPGQAPVAPRAALPVLLQKPPLCGQRAFLPPPAGAAASSRGSCDLRPPPFEPPTQTASQDTAPAPSGPWPPAVQTPGAGVPGHLSPLVFTCHQLIPWCPSTAPVPQATPALRTWLCAQELA